MELQLKNIGMIKEANVKIDGLTVIAGENDTGKSTVGKALYSSLNSIKDITRFSIKEFNVYQSRFYENYVSVFKKEPEAYCYMGLKLDGLLFDFYIDFDKVEKKKIPNIKENNINDIVFIETPLVWNFSKFFRDIALVESQMNIAVDYPLFMKELNFKLFIKQASNGIDIKEKMISLMGGQFEQDERGDFFFNKNGKRIELENTSTGIKQFGIFQVLSQNNYLNENTVLVLDEPEVHLPPKWQLEMAKVIVELVKNGVKVLVNSHSPYMIEALQRYAELEKVTADFYLAEDGYIKKENDSNSETLAKIFEKLSEPFDVFEEMDSERMEKLING
jgi:predicted ATPase